MNIGGVIVRPLYWLAGKVFSIWARPVIQPDEPRELVTDPKATICYVLETGGIADLLALEQACARTGMRSPTATMNYAGLREHKSVVALRPSRGVFVRRPAPEFSQRLRRLVEATDSETPGDLLLVPVSIYWGRSPDKDRSLFKLLFSENWELVGRTRKFFTTIVHGRSTLLRFSEPLPVKSIVDTGVEPALAFRKVARVLRVHFRQRRAATVGPDLSHRRTLVEQVLVEPSVQAAIEAEGGNDPAKIEASRNKARKYALEIAADISYPTIRVAERFLKWLWHRIYDGIELQHVDRVHEAAKKSEIIYVPCHRSHIDYLLLAYIVYEEGLHIPHVAAGINLNMPVVGSILRRGGAFFLRRSFKGNRLYAAVFDAYLHKILSRGYSIEYFIEGGRSRTGRLLTPKGGMLAMTVGSYIKNPRRPVVFVPIYFGYEKLIEGDSFINELGGAEKKRETLFGLIRSVKALRENFGKVYVNVGDPVELEPLLDRRPGQLSGGQRQRVAIGRAIVRHPDVFLFDEPLSNLDAELRVHMRIELARLHKELNTTIIYVTHDQVEAMTLADKIVVLRDGRIEQVGSPLELYDDPDNIFVAGFIGSPKMNFLVGTAEAGGIRLVDFPGQVIPSPVALAAGTEVTVGIRPEHFSVEGSAALEVTVEIIEHLGGETYAYARDKGAELITIATDNNRTLKTGDRYTAHFDPAALLVFGKDGQRLR